VSWPLEPFRSNECVDQVDRQQESDETAQYVFQLHIGSSEQVTAAHVRACDGEEADSRQQKNDVQHQVFSFWRCKVQEQIQGYCNEVNHHLDRTFSVSRKHRIAGRTAETATIWQIAMSEWAEKSLAAA
jgi:hypothetical protein